MQNEMCNHVYVCLNLTPTSKLLITSRVSTEGAELSASLLHSGVLVQEVYYDSEAVPASYDQSTVLVGSQARRAGMNIARLIIL